MRVTQVLQRIPSLLRGQPPPPNVAVPPSDLFKDAGAPIHWNPLPPHWYDRIPEVGRKIQQRFYQNLKSALGGLRMQAGRAMLVVPARNEEKDIKDTLDRLYASIAGDPNFEIVVIINATTDKTEAKIREWMKEKGARIQVLIQPTPGKTAALLEVERLFHRRGRYPEWIAQVDADTRLPANAAQSLIKLAEGRGQIAATGFTRKFRRNGAPLILPERAPPGSFQPQGLAGSFFVCRTAPWLAGYKTVLESYPQSATEDTLLSAMFRVAGFKTGTRWDAFSVAYETLGADSIPDAKKQMTRWLTGGLQLQRLYGTETLEALGLRPDPEVEAKAAARQVLGLAVHPFNTVSAARTGIGRASFKKATETLLLASAAVQSYRDAEHAVERADREGRYAWTPGR
jgi:hypothetical protein